VVTNGGRTTLRIFVSVYTRRTLLAQTMPEILLIPVPISNFARMRLKGNRSRDEIHQKNAKKYYLCTIVDDNRPRAQNTLTNFRWLLCFSRDKALT
jgi:hypothetical protein